MERAVDQNLRDRVGLERTRKRYRPGIHAKSSVVFSGVVVSYLLAVPGTLSFYATTEVLSKSKSNHFPFSIERVNHMSLHVCITDDGGNLYEELGSSVNQRSNFRLVSTLQEIRQLKGDLKEHLNRSNYEKALQTIKYLLSSYTNAATTLCKVERKNLSWEVDSCFLEIAQAAFSPPYHDQQRVYAGLDAMHLQLSSTSLETPYTTIPRKTFVNALSAVASMQVDIYDTDERNSASRSSLDEAYRILQRLVSDVGIRSKTLQPLSEKEFSQVLHAHCKAGRMDIAQRIVKLQERNPRAPPLSLVTYSILLKGYGQLHDLKNVQMTLQRAKYEKMKFDIIMMNTLIDAYINCNAMNEAKTLFMEMKQGGFSPNRRTYNTYMKGLAKIGELNEANRLAIEMKQLRLWDSITTNTLVHAAVVAGNLTYAEEILSGETLQLEKYKHYHPNVEAYTELIDVYSKTDQLDRALLILQTMQLRGVEPNEVTYVCLMGGLGRNQRFDLARKILGYMESRGLRPTTKIYNALIFGLLNDTNPADVDARVDEGMKLLREMMIANINPNSITVCAFVDALSRCNIPRVTEAKLLVDELERLRCVPRGDNRVLTSLIRSYGKLGDVEGVVISFQKLKHPDTVAVNAYMDACCRCGRDKLAIDAFELYFRKAKKFVQPDVISFAVLIGSCLKGNSTESLKRIRLLYHDMKSRCNIRPDNGLVDVILKGIIRIGSARGLNKEQVLLIVEVLKDAELLTWEDGQLNRRKRAVRAVIGDSLGDNTLRTDDPFFSLIASTASTNSGDDLFSRKGWNRVESGFRLWGDRYSNGVTSPGTNNDDKFLNKHGWNDVDSTFRLF
jgi:pentatricopeptide repeat protein